MNINKIIQIHKSAINKKYTIEECVEIMAPFGVDNNTIVSIASLV